MKQTRTGRNSSFGMKLLGARWRGAFADPGARRTRLSGSQAIVGLRQSEILRLGQELGTGKDYVCAG
jgi:hypothetical protein